MAQATASTSAQRLSDEAILATHNVHYALSPRIAVLSSSDVQPILEANHLNDFSDLLKPFEDSVEQVTLRTSQLETRRCETFPLSFDSLDTFAPRSATASTSTLFTPADIVPERPTDTEAPQKKNLTERYSRPELLLDAISARVTAKSKAVFDRREQSNSRRHSRKYSSVGGNADALKKFIQIEDDKDLQRYRTSSIQTLTPWFADTKSMVLHTRNVSEHETFGHPLAVMLIVSTNSSDPLNAFASLFEASQAHVSRTFTHRPYVDPLVLRYYVLLHDVSKSGPDLSESIALLDTVKKTYGLHCTVLPINSAAEESIEIRKLYQRIFRHDRRGKASFDGEETPPKVPAKDGQAASTEPSVDASVSDEVDDTDRWYAGKEEEVHYAACLNDDDIRKIRTFVRDFSAQSLIPFLERCVSLWNEQLTASRKGLTGRLFGAASRKLFSGGSVRGTAAGQQATSFATLGYYPHSSIEAQTRRLADFAFMTRDYKLAAAMYDLGRRDYANDKATKYVAGASEMFGLSHLMMMLGSHSPPIDVDSYLAAAGTFYLSAPRQKGSALQLDSLRATLLYYEVYQGLRYYRSAPHALVRTATEGSGDAENDLEVAGAMLMEQAAICDLRQSGRPAMRRCALHLVMAAHKYRSCGQKHLSLRCFEGAAAFYEMLKRQTIGRSAELPAGKGDDGDEEGAEERIADHIAKYEKETVPQWDLIQDHLEQELGQQASNDGQASQAVLHFLTLLQRQSQSIFSSLEQSAQKHDKCLQDFLTCCKYLDADLHALLKANGREAKLPLVDGGRSRIRNDAQYKSLDDHWLALEKEARSKGMDLTTSALSSTLTATIKESFSLELALVNPLNTTLTVTRMTVEMEDEQGDDLESDIVSVEVINEVEFAPLEAKIVPVAITVQHPRKVRCRSLRYWLADQVPFEESLLQKGRRLNDTKAQRASMLPMYGVDERLTVDVQVRKPKLVATLFNDVTHLGLGEELPVEIKITNDGQAAMRKARAIVNRPDAIIDQDVQLFKGTIEGEWTIENTLKKQDSFPIPLVDDVLKSGESFSWPILMRGSALGKLTLRVLFVYETDEAEVLTSQLQHTIQVDAVIDLAVQAAPSIGKEPRYNLSIDTINLSDPEAEEDVSITGLSFVGPAWKALRERDDALRPFAEMACLDRQQTSARLEYTPASTPMEDLDYTVQQLRRLLATGSVDKATSPMPITVHLSLLAGEGANSVSPFLLMARKEYRLSLLAQQFPSIQSTKELEHIFTLYEPNELDIVAHWQLSKSKRRGQAFVFGLHIGPMHDHFESLFPDARGVMSNGSGDDKVATRSLYAETEKQKAALWADVMRSRLHLEEDPILFDFASVTEAKDIKALKATKYSTGRRVFPVHFILRNLSVSRSREVVLQLDNTSPPPPATTTTPQLASCPQASYVDRLTFRVSLPPLSSKRIEARASVLTLGEALLSPVLVKSMTSAQSNTRESVFQRWEYCSTPVKTVEVA